MPKIVETVLIGHRVLMALRSDVVQLRWWVHGEVLEAPSLLRPAGDSRVTAVHRARPPLPGVRGRGPG